jgi:hypothetical protein
VLPCQIALPAAAQIIQRFTIDGNARRASTKSNGPPAKAFMAMKSRQPLEGAFLQRMRIAREYTSIQAAQSRQ